VFTWKREDHFPRSSSGKLRVWYWIKDVAKQFDLGDGVVRRWVKQVKFERNGGVPEVGALTNEQREIQALKKQIQRLEQEKSILKKATALLVSDEINRTR